MIPAVFGKLKDSGFFFDPVARDIETNFIPSLLEKVKTKVCLYIIWLGLILRNFKIFNFKPKKWQF